MTTQPLIGFHPPQPPPTPELEKERACQAESQKIGEFIEWLQAHHLEECPFDWRIEQLLAEYFKIDLERTETERRQILAYLRVGHAMENVSKELGLDGKKEEDGR